MCILLQNIAKVIDKVADMHMNACEKRFMTDMVVNIPMLDFLERCAQYVTRDENMFILAIILMDRLNKNAGVIMDKNNKYNLFSISFMIAIKTQHDKHYSNAYFARVCGLKLVEINNFEREFCNLLNFDINVSFDLYTMYKETITRNIS